MLHVEDVSLISTLASLPAAERYSGNPAQLSADRRAGNQAAPVLLQHDHWAQAQPSLTPQAPLPPHQRGIEKPERGTTDSGCPANVPGLPSPQLLIRQLCQALPRAARCFFLSLQDTTQMQLPRHRGCMKQPITFPVI